MSVQNKIAVVCICDGLNRRWIDAEATPCILSLRQTSLWCSQYRSVFPTVTRCSAASLTTGCYPDTHGLHGNTMALLEDGRLVVRDVGKPDFEDHLRRATGASLLQPSLPRLLLPFGSSIIYSNVSPGAAYFLDPDHVAWVYHRAGSFSPGKKPLTGAGALEVSHDQAGDQAMAARFCRDVLERPGVVLAILWLSCPDLVTHSHPLGSPAHHHALQQTDVLVGQVVETVSALRARGEKVLFLVGSDHGAETVGGFVDIVAELSEAHPFLKQAFANGRLAVANQGTSALLYALPDAHHLLPDLYRIISTKAWLGRLIAGEELGTIGLHKCQHLVAFIDLATIDQTNCFGVQGMRWATHENSQAVQIRGDACHAQHGGLGEHESSPFLLIQNGQQDGENTGRICSQPASPVDIAPTILTFFGLPAEGLQGRSLLHIHQ